MGDAQEPGAEGRVAAVLIQPVEGPQECLLREILGVARTGDAAGDADHDRAMPAYELLEGGKIACPR